MSNRLSYIDLFAGCGGLSVGLEQSGFKLELAVEKSPMAAETFYHNLIEPISSMSDWQQFSQDATSVLDQSKKRLIVKELSKVLECTELLSDLRRRSIDLVAGGPPCQGFSLAGRRNPDDVRNKLPWQFLEFVEKVCPKAVVIENVSGMSQNFKKHGVSSPFDQLKMALGKIAPGYRVQSVSVNAMHFGAPQHRPRVMLLAIRADISNALGLHFRDDVWKSEYDGDASETESLRPEIAPVATHFGERILTVADAIADLNDNGYRRRSNLSEYALEMRDDASWLSAERASSLGRRPLANHTLRKHAEHIKQRFRLYQYIRDQGISSKAISIAKQAHLTPREITRQIMESTSGAVFPAIAPDGTILANDQNELVQLISDLATKKHSQRPLSWGSPSPTVVSLPDDYVHPELPRTLTVREMARFQSFPDNFEFRSKETTGSMRRRYEVPQYTQVGNAVPPKLAKAVGLSISKILSAAATQQTLKKAG